MHPLTVVFAIHNHQPVGNFPGVIEEAYQRAYRPFLDVLERHPSVKFTQHWTGPLLEWLLERHPEFIERLQACVAAGQLELLTGTYYEAIAAVIPEADAQGQIQKLTETVARLFGVEPRGMWLAERVWEPHLPRLLSRAEVEFVVLDDTHFRNAGLNDQQLYGYYITEEQGSALRILPIDKTLRYTMPFRPVEETLQYLRDAAEGGSGRIVLYADDGEKFGVWPKTYTTVYEEGWLDRLCQMLEHESGWAKSSHLGAAIDAVAPRGRLYLPTASYSEMMKWALPASAFRGLDDLERVMREQGLTDLYGMFVRGGFWRNFLAKYPEANHMHKKMLRVSRRVHAYAQKATVPPQVYDSLWAGQCNDPSWHGVFGGLYLPNLRFPVYRSLLQAEAAMDRLQAQPPVRVEHIDFDSDGSVELLVESDDINLYFKPDLGGGLFELDYKPATFNLLDILSRREEGYHYRLRDFTGRYAQEQNIHDGVLAKEEGLARHLHVDWYRRGSLIDHFLANGTTLEGFSTCSYKELGDFVDQPYALSLQKESDRVEIQLERRGALWPEHGPHGITVRKSVSYRTGTGSFTAHYVLANRESRPVTVCFGVEFNVGLMAGDAHDRYYEIEGRPLSDRRLRSKGEEGSVRSVRLVDEWLGIETQFVFDVPATLWRFPIETVSLSEAGFERVYQSSVVFPHWTAVLDAYARSPFSVRITQSVRALR